jgi:hypothetical protein
MRRLKKGKLECSLPDMPIEKLLAFQNGYKTIMTIYKICFWTSPINLIVMPIILYLYSKSNFLYVTVLIILIYVTILEDFFFRRSITKSVAKYTEESITKGMKMDELIPAVLMNLA